MADRKRQIEEEAITWLIRLRTADAGDWESFTAWLEADPFHAAIYDEVALADDWVDALPPKQNRPITFPAPSAPRRVQRRAFLGWGIAAALVGTVSYLSVGQRGTFETIQTAAGERETIKLADGSRIELNGGSTLVLDRDNERFARLDQGEALFIVHHDDKRPFEVETGGARLVDMGTVFNVVQSGDTLEVAVSEGAVLYNPGKEAVDLRPGMTLRRERGDLSVERGETAAIGTWRDGRLTYSGAPVSRIATDLARNLGVQVRAAPDVATVTFSGVIMLDPDQDKLFRRLSSLLEVNAERSGEGWVLTKGTSGTR